MTEQTPRQTSDATFRLFDWNRPGPDGKPRTLHIEQALAAIDWTRGPVEPVNGTPIDGCPALVRCAYFCMDRFSLNEQIVNPYSGLSIWIVLAGSAELATSGTFRRTFRTGETVLVPASAPACSWKNSGGAAIRPTVDLDCPVRVGRFGDVRNISSNISLR